MKKAPKYIKVGGKVYQKVAKPRRMVETEEVFDYHLRQRLRDAKKLAKLFVTHLEDDDNEDLHRLAASFERSLKKRIRGGTNSQLKRELLSLDTIVRDEIPGSLYYYAFPIEENYYEAGLGYDDIAWE